MQFAAVRPRRLVAVGAAIVLLAGVAVAGAAAGSTTSAIPWAAAGNAAVHPGVMTFTAGAQCTSDFVFTDGSGVYLGQAAHCAGTGGSTETNGCTASSLPLGSPVQVTGASKPGRLVYSSWRTMQSIGEKDPNACAYNDLALIKIDPADVGKVNPSIPSLGGPTGIDRDGTSLGDPVVSYGNSELRFGLSLLSPKVGVSLGDEGGGWSHTVLTVTPGIPGDSGSAFLDSGGQALGILSTLSLAPLAGTNGVGDLGKELDYLHAHSSFTNVQLALGSTFRGSLL